MSSRTYTTKPSQVSRTSVGRGRGVTSGRGQGARNINTLGVGRGRINSMDDDANGSQNLTGQPAENQAVEPENRMERRDAYTMIRPDEKKRQLIAEKAREEELMYQRHREAKRISHVSYIGSVGGGQISQTEARQALQHNQNKKKLETWEKIHKHKGTQKSMENDEIERKKHEARRKAEQNEKAEKEREARLREEQRSQNERFFNKLKQEARRKKHPTSFQDNDCGNCVTDHSPDGAISSGSDVQESLTTLITMFPSYQPEILCRILDQCDGDLEKAISLLSG